MIPGGNESNRHSIRQLPKRAVAMQQIQTIYGMDSKKSFVMCCRIVGFAAAFGIYIDILIEIHQCCK